MTDTLKKISSEIRDYAAELYRLKGDESEVFEYMVDWANQIDALLAESEVTSGPVVIVHRNQSGQISLRTPDGDAAAGCLLGGLIIINNSRHR